ncbi:MAG: N-acetylneuraminate synthase family protein [Phycisphaerales bacterium]|nr:MAG: N-acetylneuraminate synthase family protein [Phycisphaerales bacterium]
MRIAGRQIGPGEPPYIVAEIGVNHDGSVQKAIELVQAAKDAGADAVKLQLYETDRLLSKAAKLAAYQKESGASDPFEMLRRLEMSADDMEPIVAYAHAAGLQAVVSIFSVELVPLAEELKFDAYKTASPDIINRPLIEAMMSTRKPLLLSTGAASASEVADATEWLGGHPHIMLHCVSAYPTPDDRAALAARIALSRINPRALGYSDHTQSLDTGALAVASGACLLERHITYDRSAPGPDHAASLDPQGFAEYVRLVHRAAKMCGHAEKRVLDVEQDVRNVSRQSLTATADLPAGHLLHSEDITIKRPGTGISPARLQSIIGRRLARRVEADMPICEEDLA